MGHYLEIREDGTVCMAYAGETPWHSLGNNVSNDLTPIEMMKAAHTDFTVRKEPTYFHVNGRETATGDSALIREDTLAMLDTVSDDWNPVQNLTAAEFFCDWVKAGDMTMETAGSLKNGQLVWFLARTKQGFRLKSRCGNHWDDITGYMLFTNPHRYGLATDVRNTQVRAVCWNTVTAAISQKGGAHVVKVAHNREFIADEVKKQLGVSDRQLKAYKTAAELLTIKNYTPETVKEFFTRVFPTESVKSPVSKNATLALAALETQPGHELFPGTWWNAANAVSYLTDHELGRSADTRLTSAWYGANAGLKQKALGLACEYAEVA